MANGEGYWSELNELKRLRMDDQREMGRVVQRLDDQKQDLDNLGAEVRKTRHDARNQLSAVEGRIIAEVNGVAAELKGAIEQERSRTDGKFKKLDEEKEGRAERGRRWLFAAIPVVTAFGVVIIQRLIA